MTQRQTHQTEVRASEKIFDEAAVIAQLKAADLRVTGPRIAILETVVEHPHLDADQIAALSRGKLKVISKQTVYDVLNTCTDVGILRRLQPEKSRALFEMNYGDNHHHLICRQCGDCYDTHCHNGQAPCLTPSDIHGFIVDEAQVMFWGICSACQKHQRTHHKAPPDAIYKDN